MATSTYLYTTVRNESGGTKQFSFLPPHGKELDDNEEYSFLGNPIEQMERHGNGVSQRYRDGFEDAVQDGTLVIKKTPNPVMYDERNDASKVLDVYIDGDVIAIDPNGASSY